MFTYSCRWILSISTNVYHLVQEFRSSTFWECFCFNNVQLLCVAPLYEFFNAFYRLLTFSLKTVFSSFHLLYSISWLALMGTSFIIDQLQNGVGGKSLRAIRRLFWVIGPVVYSRYNTLLDFLRIGPLIRILAEFLPKSTIRLRDGIEYLFEHVFPVCVNVFYVALVAHLI